MIMRLSSGRYSRRYKTGFDRNIIRQRRELKKDILTYFGAEESQWQDYLMALSTHHKRYQT